MKSLMMIVLSLMFGLSAWAQSDSWSGMDFPQKKLVVAGDYAKAAEKINKKLEDNKSDVGFLVAKGVVFSLKDNKKRNVRNAYRSFSLALHALAALPDKEESRLAAKGITADVIEQLMCDLHDDIFAPLGVAEDANEREEAVRRFLSQHKALPAAHRAEALALIDGCQAQRDRAQAVIDSASFAAFHAAHVSGSLKKMFRVLADERVVRESDSCLLIVYGFYERDGGAVALKNFYRKKDFSSAPIFRSALLPCGLTRWQRDSTLLNIDSKGADASEDDRRLFLSLTPVSSAAFRQLSALISPLVDSGDLGGALAVAMQYESLFAGNADYAHLCETLRVRRSVTRQEIRMPAGTNGRLSRPLTYSNSGELYFCADCDSFSSICHVSTGNDGRAVGRVTNVTPQEWLWWRTQYRASTSSFVQSMSVTEYDKKVGRSVISSHKDYVLMDTVMPCLTKAVPVAVLPSGDEMVAWRNGTLRFLEKRQNGWAEVGDFCFSESFVGSGEMTFVADGRVLIFASDMSTGVVTSSASNLYFCQMDEHGAWSAPASLGSVVNTLGNERCPVISPDGSTLFFSSDSHGSIGGLDVYVCHRLDSTWTNWSAPVNLGVGINTAADDRFCSISSDGRWAYLHTEKGQSALTRVALAPECRPASEMVVVRTDISSYLITDVRDLTDTKVVDLQWFDAKSGDLLYARRMSRFGLCRIDVGLPIGCDVRVDYKVSRTKSQEVVSVGSVDLTAKRLRSGEVVSLPINWNSVNQ